MEYVVRLTCRLYYCKWVGRDVTGIVPSYNTFIKRISKYWRQYFQFYFSLLLPLLPCKGRHQCFQRPHWSSAIPLHSLWTYEAVAGISYFFLVLLIIAWACCIYLLRKPTTVPYCNSGLSCWGHCCNYWALNAMPRDCKASACVATTQLDWWAFQFWPAGRSSINWLIQYTVTTYPTSPFTILKS